MTDRAHEKKRKEMKRNGCGKKKAIHVHLRKQQECKGKMRGKNELLIQPNDQQYFPFLKKIKKQLISRLSENYVSVTLQNLPDQVRVLNRTREYCFEICQARTSQTTIHHSYSPLAL